MPFNRRTKIGLPKTFVTKKTLYISFSDLNKQVCDIKNITIIRHFNPSVTIFI